MSPKSEEEVKKDLRKFFHGEDAPPDVLAFALLLNEFEVECRAILPRRRPMSEDDIQYDEVRAFAEFPRECVLVLVSAGWQAGYCSSATATKLELVCAALEWLAKHKRTRLIRVDSDVLWSLLEEVQAEFNRQTTTQQGREATCDGAAGTHTPGGLRLLDIGDGTMVVLCRQCFGREMWWREQRNRHLDNFKYVTARDLILQWEDLEVYTVE